MSILPVSSQPKEELSSEGHHKMDRRFEEEGTIRSDEDDLILLAELDCMLLDDDLLVNGIVEALQQMQVSPDLVNKFIIGVVERRIRGNFFLVHPSLPNLHHTFTKRSWGALVDLMAYVMTTYLTQPREDSNGQTG